MKHKIALLNTAIATAYGTFKLSSITLDEAIALIKENKNGVQPHIGHQATADTMTELLGVSVPMDRTPLTQEVGQIAIALKLHSRLKEGQVLHSREELEEIGYDFVKMERLS